MKRVLVTVSLLCLAAVTGCERSPTDPVIPVTEYRVGEEYAFNVQIDSGKLCSEADRDLRTGRVVTITRRAIVVDDVNNPPGGFTDAEYAAFARQFDELVWPVLVTNFGEPFDIDRNNRVVIFFTRAVNELTPRGRNEYVGGFFAARDLFPPQATRRLGACPGSNFGEIIYMLVPDPTGVVNGNVRRKEMELRTTVAVLGHELQHLINASRRLYGTPQVPREWNEEVWLNEGLSHIAEELLGFAVGELGPRQNLDAERFLANPQGQEALRNYMSSNVERLRRYLDNPDTASLVSNGNLIATRGAIWQFLRYAADRRGGSEAGFWRSLIDSGSSGLDNLRGSLGAEPMDWIQDWTVSIITDDALPQVNSRHTQPSWNFRSIYQDTRLRNLGVQAPGRYPLLTRELADGAATTLSIRAGSAAYLRFRVGAGARAELRTAAEAPSCQQSGPARTLAVGEMISLTGAQTEVVCLEGGPAGAEFVYIPFNAGSTGNRVVNLTPRGVQTVLGNLSSPGDGVLGTAAHAPGVERDLAAHHSWEANLREREQRELAPLVPGARVAPSRGPDPAAISLQVSEADQLRISIVRTR